MICWTLYYFALKAIKFLNIKKCYIEVDGDFTNLFSKKKLVKDGKQPLVAIIEGDKSLVSKMEALLWNGIFYRSTSNYRHFYMHPFLNIDQDCFYHIFFLTANHKLRQVLEYIKVLDKWQRH